MRKTILFTLEELKELLDKTFDCGVRFNTIEKVLDGEEVAVDVIEIYHNNKSIINISFPYVVYANEHLGIVELSDLHLTLENIYPDVKFTEKYDITEIDLGNGVQEYILFYTA